MDFFMQSKHLLALLCAICARLLSLPGIYAQGADSLRYLLDDFVIMDSGEEDDVTTGALLYKMECVDLTRRGMATLADAVRRMPGARLHDYGGVGGLKTVSVRGLGAKHTAVSYDGVVVSGAQSGMVDLGRFVLDNVSQVVLEVGANEGDVLRAASEYASSSLLSLRSASVFGNLCKVKVQGGSFGLANLSAYGNYYDGGSVWATVSANYMRSDGAYPFILENGVNSSRERRCDSDVESLMLEGNFWSRPFGGFFSAKAYYYDSERGLPGAVNLYNKENRERLWNRNAFAQAAYVHRLPGDVDMRVVFKYDHNYSRYKEVNASYASGEQVDRNLQNDYYASLVFGRYGFSWSYSLASDVAYSTLDNNFADGKEPRRLSSYTVLMAKYRPSGMFVFDASLLATHISDGVKAGVSPAPYTRISPALSIMWRLRPALLLRASYKDSYRVPTFADLYYLRLGNVGLKPEKASQFNVGAVWNAGSRASSSGASLSVDAYYNGVRDKIVALPTMYIWRMMNFGKARICGADVAASVSMRFSPRLSLFADANYSFQYAVDVTDSSAKNYCHQLPYTPLHSGNFSLAFENPYMNVTYMLSMVGERYMLPQNSAANRMPGYAEHSFALNRRFGFDGFGMLLQCELLNVGNEQYEVIRNYPMPGFSWRASVCVDF